MPTKILQCGRVGAMWARQTACWVRVLGLVLGFWILQVFHVRGQPDLYDLGAAWSASLAHGAVSASAIVPRAFPSFALISTAVSLDKAQVFLVDVPAGTYQPRGNITVGQGQLLVIQGQGRLLDADVNQPQLAPLSTWVLDPQAPNQPTIHILPGGAVYVRNLTIINPTFGPPGTSTAFVPEPFIPAANAWAGAVALESMAMITKNCTTVLTTQQHVCSMITQDSDVPWPAVEMEQDWLYMYRLQARHANVSVDGVLLTCVWPPPILRSDRNESVSLANAPDAISVQSLPPYQHTMVQLSDAGKPVAPVLPVPANSTSQSAPPLQCVARRVQNSAQLQRALIDLQGMSTQYVIIQVIRNMTLQPDNTSDGAWPRENMAVRIYRNVTILGRHPLTTRITEIDMNNMRNIFWVDPAGQLRMHQLTLTNLPYGPTESFPSSMFVVMMWSVAWDRASDDELYMDIRNSTLVLPESNFNYSSYWVGISASSIPSVRQLGAWQTNLSFRGNVQAQNNSHTIFIQQRWGRGIQWFNTSITDLPVVAPWTVPNTLCNPQQVIPEEPYFPYTSITPVRNAYELAIWLANPPTPVLILMNNITFNLDTVQAATPPSAEAIDAALQLDAAAVAALQQLNSTAVKVLQDGVVRVTKGVTVLGWCEGNTVLDLGNTAGLVRVDLPIDQQLSFKRLTLAGLGPASPAQQATPAPAPAPAAVLSNFTSGLWMFSFNRRDDTITLKNVTMVVPGSELAVLDAFQSTSLNTTGTTVNGSVVAVADTSRNTSSMVASSVSLQLFAAAWASARVRTATPDLIDIATARWQGIQALDVFITAALPPGLAQQLNITLTPQGLMLPQLVSTTVMPDSTSVVLAPGQAQQPKLLNWQLGLLVAGLCVAALALATGGWFLRRRVCPAPLPRPSLDASSTQNQISDGDRRPLKPSYSFSASGSRGLTLIDGPTQTADEEIRQLVNSQRERTIARTTASSSQGSALEVEGVVLDAILGQGSFGVVYRGKWRGMTVAVKTIMFHDAGPAAQRARQRGINEAAVNTLLSHDCICNMYAYSLRPVGPTGLPDDRFATHFRLYIIQEYCDAGSLAQAIDQGTFMHDGHRRLGPILQVALHIARGLQYIHENKIIHGDLSSGNIMLRTAPDTPLGVQAKVCDFGLSRFLEGPEQSHISNARQGTPYYMAPEVLLHGIMSREADVFSFGVILWELFHAQCPPWRDAAQKDALIRQQLQQQDTLQDPSAPDTGYDNVMQLEDASLPSSASVRPAPHVAVNMPLAHRQMMADLQRATQFKYTLPDDCPPGYAALTQSCLHRIPKARPRLQDAVLALQHLSQDGSLPHTSSNTLPILPQPAAVLALPTAAGIPAVLAASLFPGLTRRLPQAVRAGLVELVPADSAMTWEEAAQPGHAPSFPASGAAAAGAAGPSSAPPHPDPNTAAASSLRPDPRFSAMSTPITCIDPSAPTMHHTGSIDRPQSRLEAGGSSSNGLGGHSLSPVIGASSAGHTTTHPIVGTPRSLTRTPYFTQVQEEVEDLGSEVHHSSALVMHAPGDDTMRANSFTGDPAVSEANLAALPVAIPANTPFTPQAADQIQTWGAGDAGTHHVVIQRVSSSTAAETAETGDLFTSVEISHGMNLQQQ